MFSPDIHYLVGQEKYKDLRRDAARRQLIQSAGLRGSDQRESIRRMAGWIGSQLMTWGSKLQRYQTLTNKGDSNRLLAKLIGETEYHGQTHSGPNRR